MNGATFDPATGRYLSEDGQWAWNGSAWEPAVPATAATLDEPARPAPVPTPASWADTREPSGHDDRYPARVVFDDQPTFDSVRTARPVNGPVSGAVSHVVATIVAMVFALGGALGVGFWLGAWWVAHEIDDAFASGSTASLEADARTIFYVVILITLIVASVAAWAVLHAARAARPLLGAPLIVVSSAVFFWLLGAVGLDLANIGGLLLLPIVPAIATLLWLQKQGYEE